MAKIRWTGLVLVAIVSLAALGVTLGVTLGRVGQSAAGTLTLKSSAVLSTGDLGLWHDQAKTNAVTSLHFEAIALQPPLRSIVTPVEVFVENLSNSDRFLVKPCGAIFDSTTAALIGTMDAQVHNLDGKRLGNTCDSPPTVKLTAGILVRAELHIDLAPGLGSGDFSFETVFEAVIITADTPIEPPAGMVSWWPGDGNASDIMDGNHGILSGDATFTTGGKVGQAFSFDGTGDFVVVPDSPSLNITGDVTVDLWARRTLFGSTIGTAVLVEKGAGAIGATDAPAAYTIFFTSDDQLNAGFERADGSNVMLIGPKVTDTAFHHYSYTRSGDTHKLFMDGVEVTGDTFTGSPGDTSGIELAIGALRHDSLPGGFCCYFGGIIDEVEIFNRALSEAEIRSIFKAGPAGKIKPQPVEPPAGMVSWWPGDGHAMDIIDGNDGALQNGATFADGKVSHAFSLDGVDDFVLVPDSPNLNITGDVTVDLWAKRTSFGAISFLIAKGGGFIGGVDVPTAYLLGFNPSDELRASFELADGSGVDLTAQAVVDDAFHHYAYVRGSNTHELFIDGVLVTGGTFTGIPGDISGLLLVIGGLRTDSDPTGFESHFVGLIDEIEIFNRALTADEIRAIFEAGSAGKVKPPPDPVEPPAGMVSWWAR